MEHYLQNETILKIAVRNEIATIPPPNILVGTVINLKAKLRKCVPKYCRHLSDTIFKTKQY